MQEHETVWDHNRTYDLNADDSRNLAAVGTFCIVRESDLRDDVLDPHDWTEHLRNERLVAIVPIDKRDRGVVLTYRGRELLELHCWDRDDERRDALGDGVKPSAS
jgi:hypothetical protein